MFIKFEKEISTLTERSTTMGIEEFLLDTAEKKGIQKGIEQGIEQGIEKEREEGIKETALKMKKSGLEISLIAEITGLSISIINELN